MMDRFSDFLGLFGGEEPGGAAASSGPEAAEDREADSLMQAYQRLFSSPDGQQVLSHLMEVAGVLHSSHVPGDALQSAWREGRRQIVCAILHNLGQGHDVLLPPFVPDAPVPSVTATEKENASNV